MKVEQAGTLKKQSIIRKKFFRQQRAPWKGSKRCFEGEQRAEPPEKV
jgi:hypothetical protein